jgi:hypothetical protein
MNELSELERVKMENFALRILFMQQQLQQMQIERANFIHHLEDRHPGCKWSEAEGLVREDAGEPYPEMTPR